MGSDGESCGIRGHVFIIIQTLLLPITCVVTYLIARSQGHVEERFPYISWGGTFSPESCIFGILLAFYAFGTSLCVYVLWKIMDVHHEGTRPVAITNHVALALGFIASFGVLVVATFQVTSVSIVHYIGAVMAFGVGTIYMMIMACISIRETTIPGNAMWLAIVRLIVATLGLMLAIVSGVCGWVADRMTDVPDHGKWDPSMEGYDVHIASTASEWACAGLVSVYFMTLFAEFKHFRIGMPHVFLSGVKDMS